MRTLGIIGLGLAVGLSACASSKEEKREEAPAQEQPATQEAPAQQGTPQASIPRAKRPERSAGAATQVAVIDAGLVSSAANARALQTLGSNASTYDRRDGKQLLDNARDALSNTREQIRELRAAATDPDDRRHVEELEQRVSRADRAFERIADRLDRPDQVAENAGAAYADLAAAVQPLRNVARAMNTGVEVVGPTG